MSYPSRLCYSPKSRRIESSSVPDSVSIGTNEGEALYRRSAANGRLYIFTRETSILYFNLTAAAKYPALAAASMFRERGHVSEATCHRPRFRVQGRDVRVPPNQAKMCTFRVEGHSGRALKSSSRATPAGGEML